MRFRFILGMRFRYEVVVLGYNRQTNRPGVYQETSMGREFKTVVLWIKKT